MLKPGGRFFFNVWDRISENEFADVVTEALAGSSRKIRRSSWRARRMAITTWKDPAGADGGRLRLDFGGDAEEVSKARSPAMSAIAYCQGTPLRNEIEARDASRLGEATDKVAEELARRFGDGPIEGKIRAHIFTAIRP